MPFGLTNALAVFQEYINIVLFEYLNEFYVVYIDDIIIYFDNLLNYQVYIRKVL
jgi:hypothetical protein